MKFLGAQLSYFLGQREIRRNIRALVNYLIFLLAIVLVFSALFHIIMLYVEGQEHSWITGFYWTLTVMSTLGFGDITFHSDVGRLFSLVVLMSGIVFLIIMLPFAFIRYFYAPWLEAQIRVQAPRWLPPHVGDHVVICRYDSIAPGLIGKLKANGIPYVVLEPDPVAAAQLLAEDVSVVTGDIESRTTYDNLRVGRARMVVANTEDTVNTNITLTVREVAAKVPIVAIAEQEDSIDILELSGATHVLPLKHRLGEHLANRVATPNGRPRVVGRFKDLAVAEMSVQHTDLVGKTIRETKLRERTGTSIVAVWDRGRLLPADPDLRVSEFSIPLVAGTPEQLAAFDRFVTPGEAEMKPVVVIGGGKVGCAATQSLGRMGVAVHMVECDERLRGRLRAVPDRIVFGDAADRGILMEAGLDEAPAVLLTTNDDAVNIYLSIYCRRLNPGIRIISRITHGRNLEAIHRAGTDFVLSYTSLGVESIFSLLHGREPVIIGGGVDYFDVLLPRALEGLTLAESAIGARTGLVVVAIKTLGSTTTNPPGGTQLTAGSRLLMLGTAEQRRRFAELFGEEG